MVKNPYFSWWNVSHFYKNGSLSIQSLFLIRSTHDSFFIAKAIWLRLSERIGLPPKSSIDIQMGFNHFLSIEKNHPFQSTPLLMIFMDPPHMDPICLMLGKATIFEPETQGPWSPPCAELPRNRIENPGPRRPKSGDETLSMENPWINHEEFYGILGD
jgi:hypothetical protein